MFSCSSFCVVNCPLSPRQYETLSTSSKEEIQALRAQLEEQKERTRKEVQEAQRHGSDAKSELERNSLNLRRLEEEVRVRILSRVKEEHSAASLFLITVYLFAQMSRQKKELLLACEERDNHQLDKELLTNRLRHLEGEVEAGKNSLSEKAREVRILEVRSHRFLLLETDVMTEPKPSFLLQIKHNSEQRCHDTFCRTINCCDK